MKKKFFAIVAFSGLTVAAANAQSSDVPSFRSEDEKKAWLEANPQVAPVRSNVQQPTGNAQYEAAKQRAEQPQAEPSRNVTGNAKKPATPRADAQRIDMQNPQPAAAPVRAVNAGVESKRLPADYPNQENRTSKSDQ